MNDNSTKKSKELLPKKMVFQGLPKQIIGWKEWFSLDSLGIPAIRGKIDTGAKTSSLHAFNIKSFYVENVEYVKFDIHPLQKNKKLIRSCVASVVDHRMVCDSGGKREKRFVIKSMLCIGNKKIITELTLANRDSMTFRMLLGRKAIKQVKMLVDPSKAFLQGDLENSVVNELYQKIHQNLNPKVL